MRDLYERGGFVSPIHRAAVMEAHDDLRAAPAEPVGGDFGVGRCTVHSGGQERPQRASGAISDAVSAAETAATARGHEVVSAHALAQRSPYYAMVTLDGVEREIRLPLEACLSIVTHAHTMLWDEAVATISAAGPLPLVSPEPWVEGDDAYRKRLRHFWPLYEQRFIEGASGEALNLTGAIAGLRRARLVLVED